MRVIIFSVLLLLSNLSANQSSGLSFSKQVDGGKFEGLTEKSKEVEEDGDQETASEIKDHEHAPRHKQSDKQNDNIILLIFAVGVLAVVFFWLLSRFPPLCRFESHRHTKRRYIDTRLRIGELQSD